MTHMFYEVTEVLFTIEEVADPAKRWAGIIQIPFQQLFRDQMECMTFRKGLTEKERLKCQVSCMGILSIYACKNYMNLFLRKGTHTIHDFYEYAKGIPDVKGFVDRTMRQLAKVRKFGMFSKVIDFQLQKWFKR